MTVAARLPGVLDRAQRLAQDLKAQFTNNEVLVTSPANRGASVF